MDSKQLSPKQEMLAADARYSRYLIWRALGKCQQCGSSKDFKYRPCCLRCVPEGA